MKNSKIIIDHLLENPLFSKLNEQKCFKKIKSLLPLSLQKQINFIYLKDKTLIFALYHPSFRMEFNYKIRNIKGWLKELKKIDKECKKLDIETFKTIVIFNPKKKREKREVSNYYEELSNGKFKNLASVKELYEIFEEIREAIIAKKNR